MFPKDPFYGDTFLLGGDGKKYPLRIERVDFDYGYIGPNIQGYVFMDEIIVSKKNDSAIKKVIFNDPATIVIWSDDSKTVVKCQPGDTYSKELGLAMCIAKKYLGNKGNFNDEFKKWIPEEPIEKIYPDNFDRSCDTCKYEDRGFFDKPCVNCKHNGGNKDNYKEA